MRPRMYMRGLTSAMTEATAQIDPLPAGRIGMWLVIASDLMFFIGLVGAFLVLRAGNLSLFANHELGLSKSLAGRGVLVLIASSVTMFIAVGAARTGSTQRCRLALLATLLLACAFACLRWIEYSNALNHHTIAARQSSGDPLLLFDGRVDRVNSQETVEGYSARIPADFDIHIISQNDIARLSPQGAGNLKTFILPPEIFQDVRYGPGKNIFYATWFTLTGAHLVHVGVGLVAIVVLLLQSLKRPLHPIHVECVGLFWHFTVLVGIVLFPLLYL